MKSSAIVLLLAIMTQPLFLFSQAKKEKEKITYEEAKKQLKKEQLEFVNHVLDARKKSLDFYRTMRRISEPSTISFVGLDHTYQINRAWQKKSKVLHADIQIPIALGGKWWVIGKKRKNPAFHTLHIIPQFKVRIFRNDPDFGDESLPVRTPSYLPGISYFCTSKKIWTPRSPDTLGIIEQYQKGIFYGLRLFHHSNGQDGPEFNADGSLNVYNGNFGENIVPEFIIGGVRESRSEKMGDRWYDITNLKFLRKLWGDNNIVPNRYMYWKIGFEPHIRKLFGTSEIFDQYDLYGRYRINGQFAISHIPSFVELISVGDKNVVVAEQQEKELFRFAINFSYILDGKYNWGNINDLEKVKFFNIGRRMNLYASLHIRIKGAKNASGFVQGGFMGSDPYNIYFQHNHFFFRAGISMAFYKYPSNGDLEPPEG